MTSLERYHRDRAINRLLRANTGRLDLARQLIDAVYPPPATIGFLPFRPLWGQLCLSFGDPTDSTIIPVRYARRIGVDIDTLRRWAAQDGVPHESADRVVTALNLNPIHVWGTDWDQAA